MFRRGQRDEVPKLSRHLRPRKGRIAAVRARVRRKHSGPSRGIHAIAPNKATELSRRSGRRGGSEHAISPAVPEPSGGESRNGQRRAGGLDLNHSRFEVDGGRLVDTVSDGRELSSLTCPLKTLTWRAGIDGHLPAIGGLGQATLLRPGPETSRPSDLPSSSWPSRLSVTRLLQNATESTRLPAS